MKMNLSMLAALGACASVALGSWPSRLAAQTSTEPGEAERPVVTAARATGVINIDGRLDEASWSAAPVVSGFTQVDPEEGQRGSELTEARVLFDDEALYIGGRLHDRQPPTMRLGRRDMPLLDSDWLGVVIDSYHDHRTAFKLVVNPLFCQPHGYEFQSFGDPSYMGIDGEYLTVEAVHHDALGRLDADPWK